MSRSNLRIGGARLEDPTQTAAIRARSVPLLSGAAANIALFIWLAGVLSLGRAFAEIGRAPIFLADVLAIFGVLLALPRWWPFVVKPGIRGLLVIAAALAVLNAQSVYRGVEAQYPSALKSACMGVYPLVAVAIAGLVARDPDLLHRFATRALPLIPLGFLLLVMLEVPYIAASTGLSLACAAAWVAAPDSSRRTTIAVGTLIATAYLIDVGAKRGPTLSIVLALIATRLALRGRLRTLDPQARAAVVIVGCLAAALVLATTLVISNSSTHMDASEVPIIGSLASRMMDSTRPDSESTNNITLRQEMWRYALTTTAAENPFFGRGAGHPVAAPGFGFRIEIDPRSGVHNSFVGYAFYSGFPSAALVALAFVMAMAGSWRNRAYPAHASLFGATIAVATTCATNIALETPYIAGPAWAVIGAAVGAASARPRGEQAQVTPLTPA